MITAHTVSVELIVYGFCISPYYLRLCAVRYIQLVIYSAFLRT